MARDAEQELAATEALFSALAHPSRRQILLVLHVRGGSMTAGDIADRFRCAWPTTTRHLQVLRRAGLVHVVRNGRQRVYRLDRRRLLRVAGTWLAAFTQQRSKTPARRRLAKHRAAP